MVRQLLRKEILVEIESLHICYGYAAIKKISELTDKKISDKEELADDLTSSINEAIQIFLQKIGDEYCIPVGWPTHSIYLSFLRYAAKQQQQQQQHEYHMILRVDNLGARPREYHLPKVVEGKGAKKVYPALLGPIKSSELPNDFLKQLILTKITNIKKENAYDVIYRRNKNVIKKGDEEVRRLLEELVYSPSSPQTVGNCVVANHNVGLRIRLTSEGFYKWVLDEEIAQLGRIAYDCIDDDWPQKFCAPRQISQHVLADCKKRCADQGGFLFSNHNSATTIKYVIPSLLENQRYTHLAQEEDFIPANTLQYDRKLFVQGRAGMGKSSLCRYIASSWSENCEWLKNFTLVLYIPLRNLIADRYSPDRDHEIFDVIEKECFASGHIPAFEKDHINSIINTPKVLWVLDGYDELSSFSVSLTKVVEDILKQMPCLILTSRSVLPSHLMPSITLEMAGFSEEDVEEYIDNFYEGTAEERISENIEQRESLKEYIESQIPLKSVAKIPIQLEFICTIWDSPDQDQLRNTKFLAITNLYNIITMWLLRRFLLRDNELAFKTREVPKSIRMHR